MGTPKPGSWRKARSLLPASQNVAPSITAPIYSEDLIAVYAAFRDNIYTPNSVLHPSCGFNASPSKVFSNVTYVDKEQGNEGCIEVLQNAGLNAFKQDITAYEPKEKHDLLILLNPAIKTEWATKHLDIGAYILSNNYHGNATWMARNSPQFQLEAAIQQKDANVVITRDLDGYFEPVANGDELRRIDPERYDITLRIYSGVIGSLDLDGMKKRGELAQGFTPGENFDETYLFAMKQMGSEPVLPFKKVAPWYVFKTR